MIINKKLGLGYVKLCHIQWLYLNAWLGTLCMKAGISSSMYVDRTFSSPPLYYIPYVEFRFHKDMQVCHQVQMFTQVEISDEFKPKYKPQI